MGTASGIVRARLLDDDTGHLRRRLQDGHLDGTAQCGGRGRTPVAIAQEPELDGPQVIVDRQELDVTTVSAEEGSHGLERFLHPDVERLRVEALDQQEAGDQLVGREVGDQLGRPRLGDLGHAGQPGPVEIRDQAQQLLGQVEGPRIRTGLEFG